jgi:hypothetical protein
MVTLRQTARVAMRLPTQSTIVVAIGRRFQLNTDGALAELKTCFCPKLTPHLAPGSHLTRILPSFNFLASPPLIALATAM